MSSLWRLRGITWSQLPSRVWQKIQNDDILGRSAQLAYYFLLALFPLLLFLTSVIGIILGSGTGLRHAFFSYLSKVLPGAAFAIVDSTMSEISNASSGSKVAFGLLAALWAASNGMGAITTALNVAYDVKESRPWWKQRLIAILLTVALSFLVIGALVLVLYGGNLAEQIATGVGFGDAFVVVWKYAQWPIAFGFMLLSFALIYYLAPDIRERHWYWLSPGSFIGVVVWLLVSLGFRVYLHFFDSYSKTYGSLGAVIVLMLWLYLTGAAILMGGEVNSVIEDAAAKATVQSAREEGEKSADDHSETISLGGSAT